jgi:hypothetical protein
MLVSRAFAGHGVVDTGSAGGGNTLLVILGVGILFGLVYMGRKRWRRRKAAGQDKDELPET